MAMAISWAAAPAGKGGAAGVVTLARAPSSGAPRFGTVTAALTVSGSGAEGGVLGVWLPPDGVALGLVGGVVLGADFGVGFGAVTGLLGMGAGVLLRETGMPLGALPCAEPPPGSGPRAAPGEAGGIDALDVLGPGTGLRPGAVTVTVGRGSS